MPDHDPANRRRRNQLNALPRIQLSNRAPEGFRLLRKLKHERALQIDRAVQAAGKLKVTFEERSYVPELIDDLFWFQILTSMDMYMLQSRSNAALLEFSF